MPLTARLFGVMVLGSLFVAFVATRLSQEEERRRTVAAQGQRVHEVARTLASRAAPLLSRDDELRLAMLGASAAQFGDFRVLLLDAKGVVRMDTGLAMGGQQLSVLTAEGPLTRDLDEGKSEYLAPAVGQYGLVGEVRVRFQRQPDMAMAWSWGLFGGTFLACLSLAAGVGFLVHNWMSQVSEVVSVAQCLAHGDLQAQCDRKGVGVIADLQDSLHDLAAAVGEGVEQVQGSFLELAHQTVEVLERQGTRGHGERTCTYAMLLARRLGLSAQECRDLELAARLHDLGEVYEAPREAVNRSDAESMARELDRLRRMPQRGSELLASIHSLKRVAETVRHHREKFDGSGFPASLRGDRIPLLARILGIADAYDQLTTFCTKAGKPLGWPDALDELREDRGSTFDPWLVDLFEEEIRKAPIPTEDQAAVTISLAGVVPYREAQERSEELHLAEGTFDWDEAAIGDDLDVDELELYSDDLPGGDSR